MTDTTTAAADRIALADRAERILEVLRHRDPTEADTQACSMVMAGLTLLRNARGADAMADMLRAVGSTLTGPGAVVPAAAQAVAPEPASDVAGPVDLVAADLALLRGLPRGEAIFRANAAMTAASMFITEAFGGTSPVSPRAPEPVEAAPMATAGDIGTAIRNHLHAMPREAAAEHARAAIAGGGVFLREAFGEAAAVDALAGVTDAVRASAAPASPAAAPDPDAVALKLLDNLRSTAPDQAHEQARAAIVGAAAYLVEARGPVYTSAVVDGLLVNARRHIETWGASPRPDGVSLH